MIGYEELSDEEKEAVIELCKEDPVMFMERVCGISLLEYQREYIRRVYRDIQKQKSMDDNITAQYLGKPVKNNYCDTCSIYRDPGLIHKRCRDCIDGSNYVI